MELPDRDTRAQDQPKPPVKKNRFKLIRLEERIAPGGPPTASGETIYCTGSGLHPCPK
jgi:hypothetical protein